MKLFVFRERWGGGEKKEMKVSSPTKRIMVSASGPGLGTPSETGKEGNEAVNVHSRRKFLEVLLDRFDQDLKQVEL